MPEQADKWQRRYTPERIVDIWTNLRKRYDHRNEDIAQEVILQLLAQCPEQPEHWANSKAPKIAIDLDKPDQYQRDDGSKEYIKRDVPAGFPRDYADSLITHPFARLELRETWAGQDEYLKSEANGTPRKAECHPAAEYVAYGKCWACYKRDRRRGQ